MLEMANFLKNALTEQKSGLLVFCLMAWALFVNLTGMSEITPIGWLLCFLAK